ncbi:MAG TPA: choice-of-anchor D domain-containing protein [Thermoanaerobaculia bacterium]|nr:choice-of-anchor D domain-containing protein [Thermoanaerobaculia bacterium]
MTGFRERKTWIVFIAVLLLFAACKGETPTAPPTGGGSPPGTNPPPTGVSVTLAVSNASPLVDSTVTITATVTENGQPVPNGTAVEFVSNGGSLDGDDETTIKTTTNGVATVTLTSSAATPIRVTATVNNISQQTTVNFVARPITPVPPNTSPTIVSVSPTTGRPTGGETIRITGTNFRGPVKVLFRLPNQTNAVEASVVNATETTIDVITPGVNLGVGQELQASVIVITQAGTTSENRVERANAFTFRAERLTPVLFSVTPNSGPVLGGTRVTLVGEGFQEPVQVLFNTAEAKVLNVTFKEIIVETPPARETPPTGSGAITGSVGVTVRNLNSQTTSTLAAAFNYKNAIEITGVTITSQSRMTIDGNGFVPPVIAVVRTNEGDIGLGLIQVTGTRIIATIPTIVPTDCDAELEGPIVVTNIVNGDQAEGPIYRFAIPVPTIVNIDPTVVTVGVNSSVNVTVANPLPGAARFTIGGRTFFPGTPTLNNGTATYSVPIPVNLTFPTEACGIGGTRRLPINVDVVYDVPGTENCDDTAVGALTINPASSACEEPPPPNAAITPATGTCGNMGNVVAVGPATGTSTFTITNTGGQPLIISSAAVIGSTNTDTVTVAPTSATIAPQGSTTFTVTANPTAAGPFSGTIRVNSNDPDTPALDYCFTGNGT